MGKKKGGKKKKQILVQKGPAYSDATKKANKARKLRKHLKALEKKKAKLDAKGVPNKVDKAIEQTESLLTK